MAVTACVKESSMPYHRAIVIREEKREYVKHDQIFKELINNFFAEFLDVFFPEVHAGLDFESVKPLSEELYTDLIKGENRRVDIVIEAKLRGADTLIIVHMEPQSTYQDDFHKRMYLYFSLLYNKYRKPILPIAIFSYDGKYTELDEFTIEFPFFHVLTFNFLMLELKKKNWKDYITSDNPVAAALLGKMGYREDEKVQVKIEFLKMLTRMQLDPARSRFINDFFEQYVKLDAKEEVQFMREARRMESEGEFKFTQLPNSWEDRGIRKGLEQGIEQGIEQGAEKEREVLAVKMLREGFPMDVIAKLTDLDKEAIEKLKELN
ncbi:RpnC/YadD family protein [Sporosarcina beigongshangi]|uniref:hypothetical protein n=1 Tax=Sporosarcina beigongshangi TaxID=2782538 RepID=UPI00193972F2|nr:hypothetical protein [Sporosarcina beigongshangi]